MTVERNRHFRQSLEDRLALVGQLQHVNTSVGGITAPGHQTLLLHRVEVVGERRALDPCGSGDLALIGTGMRLECDEDHPGGLATPLCSEDGVELLAHQLCCAGKVTPDGLLRRPFHASDCST